MLELCTDETSILMENSAGAGGTIGRSIEELATIHERMGGHPRLGVCLDSCRLWVSGVDVTDAAALDACLDELESAIGLDRLKALHVNDAAAPLGSNRDRHANILEGELGEQLECSSPHRGCKGCRPCWRPRALKPRPDAKNEIRKTKELRERWLA